MAASILNQGETAIRDAVKSLVTHVGISDDTQAFAAGDTGINPGAGSTSTWVKSTSTGGGAETNVDFQTVDYTITIDGTTEFTNKVINSIGVAKGLGIRQATGAGGTHGGGSVVGTDALTRSLRSAGLGIGVQAGDSFTIGVRLKHEDNS